MLSFTIDGTPQGKKRHRVDFVSGRVHEDAEGAKHERMIKGIAAAAYGPGDPLTCPLKLTITAVFAVPSSWPKRYQLALDQGATLYHDSKPDGDNVSKLVMDALNGTVWRDDGQVAIVGVLKRYGFPERTEVHVEQFVDAMGLPPMPTPAQVARDKVTWAEVLKKRAETKAARQAALKARKAAAPASSRAGFPFRGKRQG